MPLKPYHQYPRNISQKSYLNFVFQYKDLSVRLAGPRQLRHKPEAKELQFGKIFTDHMFKVVYHKALGGWQMPEVMPFENIVLHPAAKVLHYAVEVRKILEG